MEKDKPRTWVRHAASACPHCDGPRTREDHPCGARTTCQACQRVWMGSAEYRIGKGVWHLVPDPDRIPCDRMVGGYYERVRKPCRLDIGGVQFELTDAPPGTTPDDEDDMAQVLHDWYKESVGPNPGCLITVQVNDGPPRWYLLRGITYPEPDRAVVHLEAGAKIEGYTIKIDNDGVGTLAPRKEGEDHETT